MSYKINKEITSKLKEIKWFIGHKHYFECDENESLVSNLNSLKAF
jgi:hypothetical protein